MKKSLTISAPFLVAVAFLASVHGTAAQIPSELMFRDAAKSAYGDVECGTILMTANPQYLASSLLPYSSVLKKPNATACLILASYVHAPNMTLVSHDVVATESTTLTTPYQFESELLPKMQREHQDVTTSTTFTWTPVDPTDVDSAPISASSTWTLKDGKILSVHLHDEAATSTTMQDGSILNKYDEIDHVTVLKNTSGLVYRARMGNDWYVVQTGKPTSTAWTSVDQLTVDETTSSTHIIYRAQSADGMWHIVHNEKVYDFAWKPMHVSINPVTHEPFTGDATGRFWIPSGGWKYANAPTVQGIDSKGRFLISTLSYPDMDLKELWVNNVRVSIFTIANQYHMAAPSFTNPRVDSVYFPGYVQTFDSAISFDGQDRVVIYRQEGRVFTRSVYQVK
jgi:hypothetical protein